MYIKQTFSSFLKETPSIVTSGLPLVAMSTNVGAISMLSTGNSLVRFLLTPGPLTTNGTLISKSYNCRLSIGRLY